MRLHAASSQRQHVLSYGSTVYIAAFLDFVIVLASSIVGVVSYDYATFGVLIDPTVNIGFGLMTAVFVVLAMSSMRAYGYNRLCSARHQALLIAFVVPSVMAFLLAVVFFLKLGHTFSRGAILNLAALSILSLTVTRLVWHKRLSRAISHGWLRPKNAFFVCPETMPIGDLEKFRQNGGLRITRVGRFSEADEPIARLRERLLAINESSDIDEIVIVWQDAPTARLEKVLCELRRLPLPVKVVFDGFTGSIVSCQTENLGSTVAFQVQSPPLSHVERAAKRGFDIVFSAFALLALSPMLLIIAVAIKMDSNGPVIFWQRRRGHANRPFRIAKFRSMRVMEDGDEVRQATRADPRITRVGAFIRSTSIDELPQFWNVLRGEMSVVGPRPHAVAHDDVYDGLIEEYASRRHMKPGVTGWAQVKGCRGETPSVEAMEQRVHHDLWYIDNWSLWLDVKIVVGTIFALRGS